MLRYENHLMLHEELGARSNRAIPVGSEYIYIALVERGHCLYRIEDTEYRVNSGDILVLIHNKQLVEEFRSDDYHARVALLSRAYVEFLHIPNAHRMFLSLRRCPVLQLSDESFRLMDDCFNLITSTLKHEHNSYRKHTIYYAVKTYLFTLAYLSQTEDSREPRREENIAMQFMDILEDNYKNQHSVAYYAECLHITPKYLSSSVKAALGKPAIDCISERLLSQAQKMLSKPDLTISEICYGLGFSSPSAFGKFFRTHTGLGPRQWRRKH